MRRELHFAWYALRLNFRNSAELRGSFLLTALGMMLNNVSFIVLWVFFVQSVGPVGGWTAFDIVGLQGFVALSFGVAFSAGAGLRHLPDLIASGAFDALLLSPRNLLLRVATSRFGVAALGDVCFGAICLVVYGISLDANPAQVAALVVLTASAAVMMIAAVIATSSIGFLFAEPSVVASSLFELFLTPSLFHGGAFQGGLRLTFTFLVPSLVVGALPVEAVKHQSIETLALVVLLSAAWFAGSILLFNRARRKYESTNFLTFGG